MYISIHRFSSKVFEALWQQLQSHLFEYDVTSLARMFWAISPILLCKRSHAPSAWMGSVQSGLWLVLKTCLCSLGCVLRAIVLLEDQGQSVHRTREFCGVQRSEVCSGLNIEEIKQPLHELVPQHRSAICI